MPAVLFLCCRRLVARYKFGLFTDVRQAARPTSRCCEFTAESCMHADVGRRYLLSFKINVTSFLQSAFSGTFTRTFYAVMWSRIHFCGLGSFICRVSSLYCFVIFGHHHAAEHWTNSRRAALPSSSNIRNETAMTIVILIPCCMKLFATFFCQTAVVIESKEQ